MRLAVQVWFLAIPVGVQRFFRLLKIGILQAYAYWSSQTVAAMSTSDSWVPVQLITILLVPVPSYKALLEILYRAVLVLVPL